MVGGLLKFTNFSDETTRWQVIAFEANPFFNDKLEKVSEIIQDLHEIKIYNETAAWTSDGTIVFFIDNVNPDRNYWGSSLNKGHPDVVKSSGANLTVACKDIASVIDQFTVEDILIVKMDVEGAEYDLLLDFMRKDVMRLIDYMAVEFHPFIETQHSKESVFKEIIHIMGVKFVEWH